LFLSLFNRHWLAKQPSYAASREFDVGSTRSTGVTGITNGIEDEAEDENSPPGVKRTAIQFLPSFGTYGPFPPFCHTSKKAVARSELIVFSLSLRFLSSVFLDIQHSIFYSTPGDYFQTRDIFSLLTYITHTHFIFTGGHWLKVGRFAS
jgi:hypothetical protein